MRVFHLESPGPLDLVDGRAEGPLIFEAGRLVKFAVHRELLYSRQSLEQSIRFLGTMSGNPHLEENCGPIVLHISAHGYDDGSGLAFGPDHVTWKELRQILAPFSAIADRYPGHVVLVISACRADQHQLASGLRSVSDPKPPAYIFTTEGTVGWAEAAVAWVVFYHLLQSANLDQKQSIQKILRQLKELGVRLHYWRWDVGSRRYYHANPETIDSAPFTVRRRVNS